MATLVGRAEHANTEFKNIPVIDLANIRKSDLNVQKALADEIRDACINVGFFYVKNHGIPEDILHATLDNAKRFFAQPTESKMEIENKKSPAFKGYHPILSGNNNPDNAGDMHEGFEFGWEPLHAAQRNNEEKDGAMAGANVWPSDLPGFREGVLEY
ncbi:hypothetical protein DXG03_005998 [Asterophora parasitica]|uniref:Non-haem dioxygenase N-terminal domain-containing protein n=1 Tax=Asterophora parasitica TaxID=117018 RepID=A0A9P7GB24_9AGAR|nr:hypothetical protein DXG03_005994 [Asterophora parasitica]KAG5645453.1 hypothetical protein DXG03_005998 [Asterophora parasitica]